MADKSVGELIAAKSVTPTDLFVLEQNGTAKKLTGQVLENWLVSFADGHGGIQSIVKHSTSGLKDTYRITLADTTTLDFIVTNGKAISSVEQTSEEGLTRTYTIAFNDNTSQTFTVTDGRSITNIGKTATNVLTDTYTVSYNDGTTSTFTVKNGKGISSFAKVSTVGLVDTYRIEYNDGTSDEFTVTNGAKGDKGDNQYVWIKYASKKPTASSHSFGDVADNWIGVYSGGSATAPTDWQQYTWFEIKGEKGETGEAAKLTTSTVEYQVSDSGTIIPSGAWSASVPVVAQGKYMWTRTTNRFNTGNPVVAYSVSRMGMDGSGSVSSVADISPNADGNVPLKAEDIGAVPSTGGEMTGELKMNGQPISGLNAPTANDHAANMGFVNQQVKKAAPRNLLDNSDFRNPVNQRGATGTITETGYFIDRWIINSGSVSLIKGQGISVNGRIDEKLEATELNGKTLTAAVYFADDSAICGSGVAVFGEKYADIISANDGAGNKVYLQTYDTNENLVFIISANGSKTIKAVALYEGEYTAETLPEYQPKGYGAELVECRRYYKEGLAIVGKANSGYDTVTNFDILMRVVPTVTITSNGTATFYEAKQDYIAVQNVTEMLELVHYKASADL